MEKLCDLGGGYKLIQRDGVYRFGTDAVLLAAFAASTNADMIADICSGSGAVAVLLEKRMKSKERLHIDAADISEPAVGLIAENIELNGLNRRISAINADIRDISSAMQRGIYGAVTVNPPYIVAAAGRKPAGAGDLTAVQEILCTVGDVAKAAAYLLKPSGSLFMVHRTDRFCDVMTSLRGERLEPKRIRFIHSRAQDAPELFLLESKKYARPSLTVEPPLVIYDGDGGYTPEVKGIYNDN